MDPEGQCWGHAQPAAGGLNSTVPAHRSWSLKPGAGRMMWTGRARGSGPTCDIPPQDQTLGPCSPGHLLPCWTGASAVVGFWMDFSCSPTGSPPPPVSDLCPFLLPESSASPDHGQACVHGLLHPCLQACAGSWSACSRLLPALPCTSLFPTAGSAGPGRLPAPACPAEARGSLEEGRELRALLPSLSRALPAGDSVSSVAPAPVCATGGPHASP